MEEEEGKSGIAAVSTKQAVHDLLSDLRVKDGGWNPKGGIQRINGKIENQVRIITYTFDAMNNCKAVKTSCLMTRQQIEAVELALKEIEQATNLKFRRVWHVDAVDKADIRYLQADNIPEGGLTIARQGIKNIFINKIIHPSHFDKRRAGYGLCLHETLHALGLSHPGSNGALGQAGGINSCYTGDTTLMSYNEGSNPVYALRPFDVAALQYLYGKPAKNVTQPGCDSPQLTPNANRKMGAPLNSR